MSLTSKLLSACGGGVDKLYVDDVFSTYLYTGNGSTQTINNGIDLAGKGGMVWTKVRNQPYAGGITSSGVAFIYALYPNQTAARSPTSMVSALSNGYSLATDGFWNWNHANDTYVSWTFRKAPKFFDVVTYTGNGASSRAITHLLGQEVGMVMTKATSTTGDWNTYHRSATGDLVLNTTAAQTGSKALVNSATTSTFTVSGAANTNAVTYVAYLFAHDPSVDGIIQCGSFTTNGSGNATVNLGWEPQYLLRKPSSGSGNWHIVDSARGLTTDGAYPNTGYLFANLSDAEIGGGGTKINATGFGIFGFASGTTHIYMAIRRPNKPPTTGTQVYNAIARTGTGAAATVTGVGFAPDLVVSKDRSGAARGAAWFDRLRGATKQIVSDTTGAEIAATDALTTFLMDGYTVDADTVAANGINKSTATYINHFFRRAPGFMDVVCYTGNGTNPRALEHTLGTPVEFGLIKARTSSAVCNSWTVKASNGVNVGRTSGAFNLESLFGYSGWATTWNDPSSTSSVFYVNASGDGSAENNTSGTSYAAYLFATLPGVSKVGSYIGNGATQTINCGFTTGARFILIKRADSTGDWYVWDTARGIVSANDPHLSLNTTAAEVTTDDSVDPAVSGFIVNQAAATNINVSGASYIFLSIA